MLQVYLPETNTKSPKYKDIVKTLLDNFHKLGCNISVKVHFLHIHLEYFPKNLGALSEEQGQRFHPDIKIMEKRYQGRWNINMIADYCWCLRGMGKFLNPLENVKSESLFLKSDTNFACSIKILIH